MVRDTSGAGAREMAFARCQHTATLLPSGQVLLAGGRGTTDPTAPSMLSVVAPAELYDPATARFRTTGAMAVPRASHTATLLPDGKVLVIGGVGGDGVLAQAELYDPESGKFAAAGTMTAARTGHQATLLPDGQVLVTGGCGSMNYLDLPAEAELYDSLMGAFRSAGPMYQPRADHTATHLAWGKVLILGGRGMSSVELFDGAFRLVSPPETGERVSYSSSGHTATLLPDGQVLVAGGWSNTWRYDYSKRAALYQPSTRRLADVGALGAARAGHTATLLDDGRVLIAGGWDSAALALASLELYDPDRQAFVTQPMAVARAQHTATLLPNGRVLIAGGSNPEILSSIELY